MEVSRGGGGGGDSSGARLHSAGGSRDNRPDVDPDWARRAKALAPWAQTWRPGPATAADAEGNSSSVGLMNPPRPKSRPTSNKAALERQLAELDATLARKCVAGAGYAHSDGIPD